MLYVNPYECKRCKNLTVGEGDNEYVCYTCGLVHGNWYEQSDYSNRLLPANTYKRIFYFNERCLRWMCNEPIIHNDVLFIIEDAYINFKREEGRPVRDAKDISKILRSIKLTDNFKLRHRSVKFKKTLMTEKRFYDKYYEKWKTILWKLTGIKPPLPSKWLVNEMTKMFIQCQEPFQEFRHADECDRRFKCDRYFECWHNFINYDYLFRKFLQIIEIRYRKQGLYNTFKDDFSLMSLKIRKKKLAPLFNKISVYLNWPVISEESL